MVVAGLMPLRNESSDTSETLPPSSLYTENMPTAELSFKAKNMKQSQNIRIFHTIKATMKKQPERFIMTMS